MYSFEWMHCLRPSDFLHGSLQTPWNVEVSLGCRMYFFVGDLLSCASHTDPRTYAAGNKDHSWGC